ncbi:MAG: GHKL domain-containing protein [Firmicutes bacterium]|nr:GHKL domain-containing protein [[Eubacterium] siraeum]MCM1487454.1 GHKL domain-containing protein [Bacillota bacterium]
MLLELTANLVEAFLCIHFLIGSFDGRCKLLGPASVYMIGIIGFTAVVTALNRITGYEGVLGLIYAVYLTVFSLIFLRGALIKKLFISILTNICLISTAAVSSNVLSAIFKNDPMKMYSEHSLERLVFMVTGIALLAYVLAFLSRFTGGKKESLSTKEWALILSVLAISFLVMAALHTVILDSEASKEYTDLLLASEIGIVFINILCLYITAGLNEMRKREEQLITDKRRSEYGQKYAQAVKEQYEQTRRLRHDIKQYAAAMQALIKSGKLSEAERLAEMQTENLSKIETVINVENDFLNAILNSKLTFAKSKGIDVICSIENGISAADDIDLCNLIGNLLDNAICAAEKCDAEARLIEIEISSVGRKLTVIVRNSIQASVLAENPGLKSTKADNAQHGFGIKTVKYITEKYNGNYDFYEEGSMFISRVELRSEDNN